MNKEHLRLSTIILLFTFLVGAGCNKEKIDYDPDSIIGKWEWLYTEGGFAGISYPKENESVTWEFTEDSLLIRRVNNKISFQAGFYTLQDTLFWENDPTDMICQILIKRDTLKLMDLSASPTVFSHIFKRFN
ncbi:MAG: hypothetical protein JW857_01135 [Bacteroidales bacterium]|nr:hypothetical protein [Bacteroidales bacterium]